MLCVVHFAVSGRTWDGKGELFHDWVGEHTLKFKLAGPGERA
jgi:hypothetical protein